MASFVALVDPDAGRRARFGERVRKEVAPLPGLRAGAIDCGDLLLVWAAGARAPLSHGSDENGAAFVAGDALISGDATRSGVAGGTGASDGRLDARSLLQGWPMDGHGPAAFDGFHAALRYHTREGVMAGADVLGLFPLYYAAHADVLMIATSPELFGLHPFFPFELDPQGLVGLLLAHAMVDGRSLFRGVRRLAAGHVLRWKAGTAEELLSYRITARPGCERLAFEEQVDLLHEVQSATVARHAPSDPPTGILLSGGLDTRILAGYLSSLGGRSGPIEALTFGGSNDYELVGARALAGALGMRHRVRELPVHDLSWQAGLQLRWQNLAAGFSNVQNWGFVAPLGEMPPRVLAGYLLTVIGPAALRAPDFDALIRSPDHQGFRPDALAKLMHTRLRPLVHDRHDALRRAYLTGSDLPHERSWRFDLAHRYRAHPGEVPWRYSLGSWPVMPALDRALLDLCAGLPLHSLAHRKAYVALVRRRFPALARLPLDRNSHDTMPLAPGALRRLVNPLIVAGRRLKARARSSVGAGPGGERRYYHRVYDLRGSGWQRLREEAEPYRERLADIFDMDELGRWLPPPAVPMKLPHPVRDGFRPKLLIGLMLWSAEHAF